MRLKRSEKNKSKIKKLNNIPENKTLL